MSRDHAHKDKITALTKQSIRESASPCNNKKKSHWLGMWDCEDYNLRHQNHKEVGPLQRKAEKRGLSTMIWRYTHSRLFHVFRHYRFTPSMTDAHRSSSHVDHALRIKDPQNLEINCISPRAVTDWACSECMWSWPQSTPTALRCKSNLQLPNFRGQAWASMGKSSSCMGHSAEIVRLERKKEMDQRPSSASHKSTWIKILINMFMKLSYGTHGTPCLCSK